MISFSILRPFGPSREYAVDALNHAGRLRQRGQEVLPALRSVRERCSSLFWPVRAHRLEVESRGRGPGGGVGVIFEAIDGRRCRKWWCTLRSL